MTGTLPAKDGEIGSQEIADLRRAGINVRGKPYARTTGKPRKQGRSTIHILPADSVWPSVVLTMRFECATDRRTM
jgi:hypothetical protein